MKGVVALTIAVVVFCMCIALAVGCGLLSGAVIGDRTMLPFVAAGAVAGVFGNIPAMGYYLEDSP